jgi:hypothetical protein
LPNFLGHDGGADWGKRCTIEALIKRATLDRPELLSDGALEQEITTLLSGYLVKPGV